MTFGGASTSSRATFVQRAMSSAPARGPAPARRRAPQTTKRSTAGLPGLALPAARVVAAEHGALDDRLHLARLGHRQRVVERPGDRAVAAARAHGPGRRGPQVLRVDPVASRRGRRRRARSSRPTWTTAIGSASAAERASRPSNSASSLRTSRPPAASARTSASTSAGPAAVTSTFIARGGDRRVQREPEVIACFYHRSVRVRILGSAAGGGFPQWNCRCPTCEAARGGAGARPRTQSSIAIRGDEGPWFLANASPDLRQQLEVLAGERADGVRAAPVAGVLLTDAEIDHTAGLLLLRESATPLRVYGSEQVRRALTDGYPVLPILAEYCGVDWRTLEPGRLGRDRGLLARGRVVRGRRRRAALPRRAPAPTSRPPASCSATARRAACSPTCPGLARLDDDVLGRLAASDVVLVDGTFWRRRRARAARDLRPDRGADGPRAALGPAAARSRRSRAWSARA